mmetsp:Transcript_44201/g.86454  ORF Transcript_44201/g.86454 Transcript_44201/m.86454 type:complete len:349 (-) Transcript_44201:1826-2872(-)
MFSRLASRAVSAEIFNLARNSLQKQNSVILLRSSVYSWAVLPRALPLTAERKFCSGATADPDELYQRARELEKDDDTVEEAARLFEEASALGHTQSYMALGDLYVAGRGVERDNAKAFEMFSTAANCGDPSNPDPEAITRVAQCYLSGTGVTSNVREAIPYLKQAARANHADATATLSVFYTSGAAGERSLEKAAELLIAVMTNEEMRSTCTMLDDVEKNLLVIGNHFMEGSDLARKNPYLAFTIFSTLNNHCRNTNTEVIPPSQYCMAICFSEGIGCEEDDKEALRFLELSAANKYPEAMHAVDEFRESIESGSDSEFEEVEEEVEDVEEYEQVELGQRGQGESNQK